MVNRKVKFGIGIAIILAAVAYEAVSGFQESKSYGVTVQQLISGKSLYHQVRVGGTIEPNSIERRGEILTFSLSQGRGFGVPLDPNAPRIRGLVQNALNTVRTWKFRPGAGGGVPTRMRVVTKISFTLIGSPSS